jgi:hypothetical protein
VTRGEYKENVTQNVVVLDKIQAETYAKIKPATLVQLL